MAPTPLLAPAARPLALRCWSRMETVLGATAAPEAPELPGVLVMAGEVEGVGRALRRLLLEAGRLGLAGRALPCKQGRYRP